MSTVPTDCAKMAALVRDKIRLEPDAHQQAAWMLVLPEMAEKHGIESADTTLVDCNTTGCVAGWTSMLAGDKGIIYSWMSPMMGHHLPDGTYPPVYSLSEIQTPDGRHQHIADRAQELLCLDTDEREWLFSEERLRAEVLNALDELSRGENLSMLDQADMTRAETDAWLAPLEKKATKVIKLEDLIGDTEELVYDKQEA